MSLQIKSKPEEFVERANRLDRLGQTDAALDLLYDQIDQLLRTGKVQKVDSILEHLDLSVFSVHLLLGLLTSTLPAKTRLNFRRKFFSDTEALLKARGEWEEGLLTGLES